MGQVSGGEFDDGVLPFPALTELAGIAQQVPIARRAVQDGAERFAAEHGQAEDGGVGRFAGVGVGGGGGGQLPDPFGYGAVDEVVGLVKRRARKRGLGAELIELGTCSGGREVEDVPNEDDWFSLELVVGVRW